MMRDAAAGTPHASGLRAEQPCFHQQSTITGISFHKSPSPRGLRSARWQIMPQIAGPITPAGTSPHWHSCYRWANPFHTNKPPSCSYYSGT